MKGIKQLKRKIIKDEHLAKISLTRFLQFFMILIILHPGITMVACFSYALYLLGYVALGRCGQVPHIGAREVHLLMLVVGMATISATYTHRRWQSSYAADQHILQGLPGNLFRGDEYIQHHIGVSPFEWLSFDKCALGES